MTSLRLVGFCLIGLGAVSLLLTVVLGLVPGAWPQCGSLFAPNLSATYLAFGDTMTACSVQTDNLGLVIATGTFTLALLVVGGILAAVGRVTLADASALRRPQSNY